MLQLRWNHRLFNLVMVLVQLFEFGDKYRGKYDESLRVVKSYYASVSGYMDELLWGATWLYRATDNDHYISYVVDMAHQLGGLSWAMSEFSWDVKFAGVQLLASMVSVSYYQSHN